MASFPELSGGVLFMHPSTRTKRYVTNVRKFGDGSEQRNQSASAARVDWFLTFKELPSHEMERVRQFFIDAKGKDGTTWDITVDAVLYENMTFLSDEFPITELVQDYYDFTLRARQLAA